MSKCFFSFSVREFVVSVLFLKRRNAQQNLKWNSMPLNYCRCVCSTSVVLVGILNLIAKVYLRKHASPHIKRYVLILYSNQQSTFSRLVPGSLKNGRLAGFLQVVWLKKIFYDYLSQLTMHYPRYIWKKSNHPTCHPNLYHIPVCELYLLNFWSN